MLRWLFGFVILAFVTAGAAYYAAGRGAPPAITISQPDRFIGQTGAVDSTVSAPGGRFTSLTISLEQNGRTVPLFSLIGSQGATLTQIDRDRMRISRPFGKQSVPELQQGSARVVVSASRPSFLGLRTLSSAASKDFQVRLEPPRIAVVSTHHYINHGGAEMVVYRATPDDVCSGVLVGDVEYPGCPVGNDPAVKAAFFALLWDQPLNARIVAFARD